MLGGLVERALPLLELLAQEPDPLLELIELRGAALERADRPVDRIDPPLGRPDRGRDRGDRVRDPMGLLRLRGELAEPSLGAVHAGPEPLRAVLELGAQRAEVGQAAVDLLDDRAARLDVGHRGADLLHVAADPLDRRLHGAQLLHLGLDLPGPAVGGGEPLLGLGVALAHARHLGLGEAHLLEPVGHHLVRALQRGELADGLVELRLEDLDPLHPLRRVAGERLEVLGVRAHRGDAPGLLAHPRQLLRERRRLLGQRRAPAPAPPRRPGSRRRARRTAPRTP